MISVKVYTKPEWKSKGLGCEDLPPSNYISINPLFIESAEDYTLNSGFTPYYCVRMIMASGTVHYVIGSVSSLNHKFGGIFGEELDNA
jgi:hypothetical protein